jgi:hypothetical protein
MIKTKAPFAKDYLRNNKTKFDIKWFSGLEMVPYNSLIFCVDDQKSKMATTTGIPANSPIF